MDALGNVTVHIAKVSTRCAGVVARQVGVDAYMHAERLGSRTIHCIALAVETRPASTVLEKRHAGCVSIRKDANHVTRGITHAVQPLTVQHAQRARHCVCWTVPAMRCVVPLAGCRNNAPSLNRPLSAVVAVEDVLDVLDEEELRELQVRCGPNLEATVAALSLAVEPYVSACC